MNNDYYVYLYLREDGTPYYVGKGRGDRAFKSNGRRMKRPSDKTKIVFHSKNLTEDQAFAIEKELIAKYGRKDNNTGILRNLTDGGEGTSGHSPSISTRIKISQNNSMKTPEVKAKALAALNTPEAKAKREAALKTPEVKAKRKASLNKPEVKAKAMAGLYRPEVIAKRNVASHTPEAKAKRLATLRAKKKLERSTSTANLAPFFMST